MKEPKDLKLLKVARRVLYACAGAAAVAVFLLCSVDDEVPTDVIWRGGVVVAGVGLLIHLGLRLVEREMKAAKEEAHNEADIH